MVLYSNIFLENLNVGKDVVYGVIVSCAITKFMPLNYSPFGNRALEVGAYNIIQHDYYSKTPLSNLGSIVDNFIYRGAFQGVKWFPNRHIQNKANEYFHENPLKAFLVPLSGMTPFFTIGAVESILIKDPMMKICFSTISSTLLSSIPFRYPVETEKTSHGAVYLSAQSTLEAQAGLIASFAILDLAHIAGITEKLPKIISLPQLTIASIIIPEVYNLATNENATLTNSLVNISNEAMRIAAFSLAKAIAVTTVTFASHNPIVAALASGVILYEGYNIYNEVIYEGKDLGESIYDGSTEIISLAAIVGMDYIFT